MLTMQCRDYAKIVVNGQEFAKFRSPGSFPLCLVYLVLKADRDTFIRWLEASNLPVPAQKGKLETTFLLRLSEFLNSSLPFDFAYYSKEERYTTSSLWFS